MDAPKKLVRFDTYVKRHPSLTVEEFHRQWTEVHAQLLKHWLECHGVHRYTIFHPLRSEQGHHIGPAAAPSTLDFDGHAEILVDSLDIIKALQEDPYYKAVIEPDESNLIDFQSVRHIIGYEEVWVLDGKAV
ncbi:conserved hypothetical protein [Talaromyces stipitatus ATCC 10500]|uniref:EthD domain-containing protein n=1 Tax=Talaromyces stipitatus (strain ATCC 10500 / CBS 375.48 / QM 6759 / NRRL 1006) TaxID=441959 RepID=B8MSU2_TALSN|nr:uncharacterized protein TSTA_000620 [Talaromyces stipitatus ATCC 10500]EED11985.1 conserved hypothetical protein [Talaromyces stipitatus ATCC 10500]